MASVDDLLIELETRRDRIARLEQERADLQIEIDAFRETYLARVGAVQAELQALDLHVAEYRLRIELLRLRGNRLDAANLEAEVEWQLRGRREQYAGYAESVERAERVAKTAAPEAEPSTPAGLKALYRDLAKRAHPDLAPDESERLRRGALMAQINEAYARSDRAALQSLWTQLLDATRTGVAFAVDDVAGLKSELQRLDEVIFDLRAAIADLNRSDWMAMKLDAALARPRGIDWFGRARREIEARVSERRLELDSLIAEFMQLVQSAGLA